MYLQLEQTILHNGLTHNISEGETDFNFHVNKQISMLKMHEMQE